VFKKSFVFVLLGVLLAVAGHTHNPAAGNAGLRQWQPTQQAPLLASFLLLKNDTVLLETATGAVLGYPLAGLSNTDRQWVQTQHNHIEHLNQSSSAAPLPTPRLPRPGSGWVWALLGNTLLLWFFFKKRPQRVALVLVAGAVALLGFKTRVTALLSTDPAFVDAAFDPYKPNVATHWDDTWFYVESKGIPTTHPMMTGIVKWQQQVPIPQCYLGNNAWQIPLNPVLATTPVPVNPQHFTRGAVALAANGVPIFNPYTNTGVDALVDGQLDQWGGHSGRADDYHYHTAPLHLEPPNATEVRPIAFALDGFAVYGSKEPDGTPMTALDDNHGHFDAAGSYHYHGTTAWPYMIGRMVGVVTEDATFQIVPQPHATPVRPSLTPLNGAAITDCTPNAGNNGYVLTYTRNSQTYQVDYSWTTGGVYTYKFIGPAGTTTETYNGFVPCEVPTATGDLPTELAEISVSPNPATTHFSLKINGLKSSGLVVAVRVVNTQGQVIYQHDGPVSSVETARWPRGLYHVQVQFSNTTVTRQVVLQ
jgi:hypothetical protein